MPQAPAPAVNDEQAFTQAWQKLIKTYQLEVDTETPHKGKGNVGNHPFEIRWDREAGRVRVAIRRVPLFTMRRRSKNGGLITGDASFDARVRIEGDRIVALAALNAKSRQQFLEALSIEPQLERGVLMCELKATAERLQSSVETLSALAITLSAGHSFLCPRLWHRYRTEPDPGVRFEVLDALLTLRPPSEVKVEAATAALDDASTKVAERARKFLSTHANKNRTTNSPVPSTPRPEPEESTEPNLVGSADPATQLLEALSRGHRGDRAIDQLAMDTRVPVEVRIAAMAARADGTGTTRDILRATMISTKTGDSTDTLLEATLSALADTNRATLMAVADGLIGSSPEDVRDYAGMLAILASVLGSTGDSRAEPRLLKILQVQDHRCQRAAVRALGSAGTTGSLFALTKVTEEAAVTTLRRAARRATDRIQQRYGSLDTTDRNG